MDFDIFRVDWILVSSVSIIFLIIFLILVKIYKILTRWRYKLANEDISISSYKSIERKDEFNIKVCLWNYAINNKLSNKNDPIIFVLRTKRRMSLLRVISEGLSSYGLRVVNLMLSISKKSLFDISNDKINDEAKSIIDSIIKATAGSINNDKYIIISFNDKICNAISIKNEKNYLGHIIINSKVNFIEKPENLTNEAENKSLKKVYLIFSEYNIIKFKNKTLEKCSIQKLNNSIIIGDASRNFKYFETVLFGNILNLINKIRL